SGPGTSGPYPTYPPSAYPSIPDPHPVSHPAGRRSPRHPAGRALAGVPVRTHRWGLGAYVLVEAVFLLTSVLIGWAVLGDLPVVAGLILALAVPTVLAAGTAVLITVLRGNGPRTDLRLQWSWSDVGLGAAFGLGGLALTVPASLVYVAIVGPDASSAVGDVFGSVRTGPVLAAVVLVIVVFLAPLCEEIVYRGLLWGGIERLANRWVAFGVTTLLFAMAHFEFTRTPLLLIVAIPIAVARLYTGRLLPSIVAHQVNNLLPGVVLMLGLLGVMPTG
ncbi:MAG TPA: type II CAAX endopeptidase family protein, partial [Pseudonocardia sp.]